MDALISYTVYNSIILSPLLLVLTKSQRLKPLMPVVYTLCLVFIISLVSVRFQVGRDFANYERIFNEIGSDEFERMEFGFRYLILWLNKLEFNSQYLFFFVACVIYISVFKIYRVNGSVLLLVIWLLLFFLPSLNQLRQYMAVALLTLAISKFDNKKRYMFLVFLATSFHYTGIIGIVYLLLSKVRVKGLWLLALFSPILILINLPSLILSLGVLGDSYYAFYLQDSEVYAGEQTLSIGGAARLLLPFTFILVYRKDNREFINLIKNGMAIYIALYFLSINFYVLYRVYTMFLVFLPFAAYYLYTERKNSRLFVFAYAVILFILFQKGIYEQTIEPANGNAIYPYQTIFSDKVILLGEKGD